MKEEIKRDRSGKEKSAYKRRRSLDKDKNRQIDTEGD